MFLRTLASLPRSRGVISRPALSLLPSSSPLRALFSTTTAPSTANLEKETAPPEVLPGELMEEEEDVDLFPDEEEFTGDKARASGAFAALVEAHCVDANPAGVLSETIRDAMYERHKSNPQLWTAERLAREHNLWVSRSRAALLLSHLYAEGKEESRQMGKTMQELMLSRGGLRSEADIDQQHREGEYTLVFTAEDDTGFGATHTSGQEQESPRERPRRRVRSERIVRRTPGWIVQSVEFKEQ